MVLSSLIIPFMSIEKQVAQWLIKHKNTLSIAESCTGGLLAHRLTNIPGSSQFLKLGIIAYSNEAKSKLLKVPPLTIKKHGAVSAPVALRMARQVKKIAKTNFGVSISGIAGPTGGTKNKPVGLVFIALCSDKNYLCIRCLFKENRLKIKSQAATQALLMLLKAVQTNF